MEFRKMSLPPDLLSGTPGLLRAVPSMDGRTWAASFPLKETVLFRGEAGGLYDLSAEYTSLEEPRLPFQREALRWATGEVVKRYTGRSLPPCWSPLGLLLTTYLGRGFVVFYWKSGPADLLEFWGASAGRGLLVPESDPKAFFCALRRLEEGRDETLGRLTFVLVDPQELTPLFSPE